MNDVLNPIIIRSLRHRIFSLTPKFRLLVQSEGDELLDDFFNWVQSRQFQINWMLHVALLNWLKQQEKWQSLIDETIIKELLIAAATRWSLSGLEHVKARGILLASAHLPNAAIGLWKNKTPDEISKIQLLKLSKSLTDGFGVSYVDGEWDNVKWVAMPATIRSF